MKKEGRKKPKIIRVEDGEGGVAFVEEDKHKLSKISDRTNVEPLPV